MHWYFNNDIIDSNIQINSRKNLKKKGCISIFKSLYLLRDRIAILVKKSTAEITKATSEILFVVPNSADVVAVIAIASFMIDDTNRQIFWITTDPAEKRADF